MKLQALGDTIIIKLHYSDKVKSIYIPDISKAYNADFYGEIVSIGSKSPYKNELKIGDKICFQRHEGRKMTVNNDTFLVLKPYLKFEFWDGDINKGEEVINATKND